MWIWKDNDECECGDYEDQCDECGEYGENCECESDLDEDYDEEYCRDHGYNRCEFADPGGNSALRAASASNPRNKPCPTCGRENMLTPADVARGYQCDHCANMEEGCY